MAIPIKYRESTPFSINFDFADTLSDIGYITMFAFIDEAGTTSLIRQTLESSDPKPTVTGTSGNIEKNFDFTFETAAHVKGDLFVSITIYTNGSASNAVDNVTTIEIFHVDSGATETSIGTQQTMATLNNPSQLVQDEARHTATFDINKVFKKGEKLRIEVISTLTNSGNANNEVGFYADPAARNFILVDQHQVTGLTSQLKVLVPFPLNL